MVMLFGKQISVSTTSHQHQEAESDDPSNNPPLMGSLGGDSKTRVFLPDHHQENPQDSDRAADSDVNLGKFRSELDFLGLRAQESDDPTVVLNPEPLRWFHPSNNRIFHPGSCSKQSQSDYVSDGKKKRKSMFSDENKKLGKRKKMNYPQVPTINLSSEFRRGIIGQTIDGPVFVYRKKLEGSDVKKQQNRLLITEEEKLLDGFLSGDESEMFHGGRGVKIDVVGVDGRGREFELRLSKWKTMIVINGEWYQMVVANGAVAGHWVDLWGFRREDAKVRFALNFSSQ